MNTTEKIVSVKPVVVEGRDQLIVTTESGAIVWVPKAQFDLTSETITYSKRKAGDAYIGKDGKEGKLRADRNDFIGCGKQIVRKYDALELLTELHKRGVEPKLAIA